MKHIRTLLAAAILLIVGGIAAFSFSQEQAKNHQYNNSKSKDRPLRVMVSILPQVQFVKKIGGTEVEVTAMVREGYSPATYEATPQQMKDLADSDLYMRIGYIPFELTHMEDIAQSNPALQVVDTSENVPLRTLEAHTHEHEEEHNQEDEHIHKDEHDHDHEEGAVDPHIWLSPQRVRTQVENICNALIQARPEKKEYFLQNKELFLAELDTLNTELNKRFTPFAGQTMLVYHPAFGYLAEDYGFRQEHIEIQGKEPSLTVVQRIIQQAEEEKVQVIFVQKQFSTRSAEAIAQEINGAVVPINPLAQDYITNMQDMAEAIVHTSKE